jgi:hypothetical protein
MKVQRALRSVTGNKKAGWGTTGSTLYTALIVID